MAFGSGVRVVRVEALGALASSLVNCGGETARTLVAIDRLMWLMEKLD